MGIVWKAYAHAKLGGYYTELVDSNNMLKTQPTGAEPEPSALIVTLEKGQ